MKSIKLPNVKHFMHVLLCEDVFDDFFLHEAVIKKNYTVSIQGEGVSYGEVRAQLFEHIKGKSVPERMQIVLSLPPENPIVRDAFKSMAVKECHLNIRYGSKGLYIITGISYSEFVMDKSADHMWDEGVLGFLDDRGTEYEVQI